MNCFNEEEIQKYIDGELSEEQQSSMNKHIATCKSCKDNIRSQKNISNIITQELNSLISDDISIPNIEIITKRKNIVNIRRIVYTVSAASLIFVLWLFLPNSTKTEQNQIVTIQEVNQNINREILEPDFLITVVSPDGKVTEYYLE